MLLKTNSKSVVKITLGNEKPLLDIYPLADLFKNTGTRKYGIHIFEEHCRLLENNLVEKKK